MKIIIVDDSEAFREGLKYYLQKNHSYEIINEANNGIEFLNLKNIHDADIILMDIQMPELDGIKTVKKVLWNMSFLKIIAITMYRDKAYLKELVEAGFRGCVFKNEIFQQLHDAIEDVKKGKYHYPDNLKHELLTK